MILQMLADYTILLLKGITLSVGGLALLSFSQLLSMLFNIFIFSIFTRAILSWLTPSAYSSATSILYSLTEPLLGNCRKLVPTFAGMDWSPLVALIGLQLAKMLLIPPLQKLTMLIG